MNDSNTAHFGLIGHPIERSPSPAMHNAGFRACNINADYGLFDADMNELGKVKAAMQSGNWRGFNVTTPLKTNIADLVELNGDAVRAKATNTIWRDGETWRGELTDVHGIQHPLSIRRLSLSGRDAMIIGAGGAARAAALACEHLGLRVNIIARRAEAAEATLDLLRLKIRGVR